jgi:hypothetical protein
MRKILHQGSCQSPNGSPYPSAIRVCPCYIRLGKKGPYTIPEGQSVCDNFDWKTEVEFIVIA